MTPGLCMEIYRTVVARAEGDTLTQTVRLPTKLFNDLAKEPTPASGRAAEVREFTLRAGPSRSA